MMNGSSQLWKFTTISRYTSRMAKSMPDAQPDEGVVHGLHLAADIDGGAARQVLA